MAYLERQIEKLKGEKYNGIESEDFFRDAERLKKGEPYEYVLGYAMFLGVHIDLSLRPMIPRPETAFWVERAIGELREKKGSLRIADTFSGAGNVGLAIAHHLPEATVELYELDPRLIPQIEISRDLNKISRERVTVKAASALDGLTQKNIEPAHMTVVRGASEASDQGVLSGTSRGGNERSNKEIQHVCGLYDAIFAVPPYVPYDALPNLDPEMINYEPHLAFFAHDEGHEFHKLLINNAYNFLKEAGVLYMEADMDHNEAIRTLVEGTPWKKLEFWPDPYGATPNVVLRK
jgi:release factor glutamine methyltransferase